MLTFNEFMILCESRSRSHRAQFAQQLQDYEKEQQSKTKLQNKANQLKQRQRRRERQFKNRSQDEMQRQYALKAKAQRDADSDTQQSRQAHRQNITSMTGSVTNAAKSSLKGGAKLIKYASNKIRNRGR